MFRTYFLLSILSTFCVFASVQPVFAETRLPPKEEKCKRVKFTRTTSGDSKVCEGEIEPKRKARIPDTFDCPKSGSEFFANITYTPVINVQPLSKSDCPHGEVVGVFVIDGKKYTYYKDGTRVLLP